MLPLDKLNMIQMLNITDTLGRLDLVSKQSRNDNGRDVKVMHL
jgi:exportin-T